MIAKFDQFIISDVIKYEPFSNFDIYLENLECGSFSVYIPVPINFFALIGLKNLLIFLNIQNPNNYYTCV